MERRVRIDRVVTTTASGQIVEYRGDHVDPLPRVPGQFERHYARVIQERETLQRPQIEAELHGEERVLMRTLWDYEAGILWKAESVIEAQQTPGVLGSRTEEVEVALADRIESLEDIYRIEHAYGELEFALQQHFSDWNRQCGGRGFLLGTSLERLVDDPLIVRQAAITLATLIAWFRNQPERVKLEEKDERLFADRFWLGETWFELRTRLVNASRHLLPNGAPNPDAVYDGVLGDAPLEFEAVWDNPNETCSVRFAAGVVTVPPPTDAELLVLSGSGRDGCWATVVHKAWLELQQIA